MGVTRITKEIDYFKFCEIIDKYSEQIKINLHAYFRLQESQRKVYKEEALREILSREKPAFIGIQRNGNYAVFFKRKEGYLRIIFKVEKEYVEIITFYLTSNIPNI